jgi:L-alanine-DL-glutamate epimerase-like enolase superfamily enzyme
MKIESVSIRRENLALTRPYTIAFKTIDNVENGIIEIMSDSGITGYGAFNPSYEVVGETLEHAMEALAGENIAWLAGKNIADANSFNLLIQKVTEEFKNSPSARIGLEIALYDLFTQMLGMPLVRFLGQKIFSMPTSVTIGIKNVGDTLAEAKDYIDKRFKILKVKLGASLQEDVERLVKLREKFGYDVRIIIDVNQGYTPAELVWFYDKVKHLRIELIEQPLKKGEETYMRQLPGDIKQLVAADESLISATDAAILAQPPAACGLFNIKLMKCGGIKEALSIAGIANANNIGLMWGCNDESIISITAALHVAFSCPHTKFIDLDGSLDLAEDVVAGGFILKNGIMSIADKPGLGLQAI